MSTDNCVLFLDFDGVTHPQPCFQENVFCRLPLIEAVLRERELRDVEIVISSSWRDHYSLDEMREFFSLDFYRRVIGVTPSITKPGRNWMPGHEPEFEREWECLAWIKTNRPSGTRWLAIDDRPYWFRPESKNLLLTDAKFGFSPADAETLRDMLWERL